MKEIDEKQDVPSVGFGMGIERILLELDNEGISLEPETPVALYVGVLGKEAKAKAYSIVQSLRKQGLVVETDYLDRSVKAQMKYANKIGAKYSVILGGDELSKGEAFVKNMEDGSQETVSLSGISDYILNKCK